MGDKYANEKFRSAVPHLATSDVIEANARPEATWAEQELLQAALPVNAAIDHAEVAMRAAGTRFGADARGAGVAGVSGLHCAGVRTQLRPVTERAGSGGCCPAAVVALRRVHETRSRAFASGAVAPCATAPDCVQITCFGVEQPPKAGVRPGRYPDSDRSLAGLRFDAAVLVAVGRAADDGKRQIGKRGNAVVVRDRPGTNRASVGRRGIRRSSASGAVRAPERRGPKDGCQYDATSHAAQCRTSHAKRGLRLLRANRRPPCAAPCRTLIGVSASMGVH